MQHVHGNEAGASDDVAEIEEHGQRTNVRGPDTEGSVDHLAEWSFDRITPIDEVRGRPLGLAHGASPLLPTLMRHPQGKYAMRVTARDKEAGRHEGRPALLLSRFFVGKPEDGFSLNRDFVSDAPHAGELCDISFAPEELNDPRLRDDGLKRIHGALEFHRLGFVDRPDSGERHAEQRADGASGEEAVGYYVFESAPDRERTVPVDRIPVSRDPGEENDVERREKPLDSGIVSDVACVGLRPVHVCAQNRPPHHKSPRLEPLKRDVAHRQKSSVLHRSVPSVAAY